ncbi:MAG: hypothetical protein ACWGO1_08000, partial [Anaerolineales bacterium]
SKNRVEQRQPHHRQQLNLQVWVACAVWVCIKPGLYSLQPGSIIAAQALPGAYQDDPSAISLACDGKSPSMPAWQARWLPGRSG